MFVSDVMNSLPRDTAAATIVGAIDTAGNGIVGTLQSDDTHQQVAPKDPYSPSSLGGSSTPERFVTPVCVMSWNISCSINYSRG